MLKISISSKKNKLIIGIILSTLIILGIFSQLKKEPIEIVHLNEEEQPVQILSHDKTVINYQKTVVQNPFEVIINFTCDRQTGEMLDYTTEIINHDLRLKSMVEVDPYIIATDTIDGTNYFLYEHQIEINVVKETMTDFELLERYGFLTEEEWKQGEKSLKSGWVNCFIRKNIDFIQEALPKID